MFLQRLIADDTCGLNYDYMGSAEFEFGATRNSRVILAKYNIESAMSIRRVRFFEQWGRSRNGPVDVYVFGALKTMHDLGIGNTDPSGLTYDLLIRTDKESARLHNDKIVGWMSVLTDNPILILRDDRTNLERGDKFLSSFIDGITQEEKKAQSQELHTYSTGHTIRRVDGPVLLPQNNGIPIEGNGYWVLFDEGGNALDRDKYHSDLVDRNYRKIGDPLPV